jgi:hypothetical protein
MFEYIFPIFCFGVVIMGIVAKGMMAAADMARGEPDWDSQERSARAFSRFTPTANDLDQANDRTRPEQHSSSHSSVAAPD